MTMLTGYVSLNVLIITIQHMVNIYVWTNAINTIQDNFVLINANLDTMVMIRMFAPYVLRIA